MKIAVVGSGIAGLVTAYVLGAEHEVVLFEADSRPGGHSNTVTVDSEGEQFAIDTGFIVYNDWTYPNFIGLLDHLGVESVPTSMSFSVRCSRCGLEYSGSSLAAMFSQRRNLARPAFYRLLADILRFNRWSTRWEAELPADMTVRTFLSEYGYSTSFSEHYLLPMGAAIWSCPMATFSNFPIRFIFEFYRNHGLLSISRRPVWRTIAGGSRNYVNRILLRFRGEIRVCCPVLRVERDESHVKLHHSRGAESFDEVILACHSDQALAVLEAPTHTEQELLTKFPYGRNVALLHTDETVMPQRRSAWASWNYHVPAGEESRPAVTYNMNILQHLKSRRTFCVTLNDEESVDPGSVFGRLVYSHPIFTIERSAAQQRHRELIRQQRTSFCGAYWGNGFHEDGVNSALTVCRAFGVQPSWSDACHSPHDGNQPEPARYPGKHQSDRLGVPG